MEIILPILLIFAMAMFIMWCGYDPIEFVLIIVFLGIIGWISSFF